MEPLCDKGLAALHVRFIVPLAVSRMLSGEEALDDIAEYTIQDIFSEFQPDAALLGLALCAQHIGAATGDLAIGRVLGMEAGKIVEEYGPVWLAYESGQLSFGDKAVTDLLVHVPEDLESLGDLLLATCDALGEDRAIPAILCDILGQQADLHREYAEAQLESLGDTAERAVAAGGNVVPFPRVR